MKPGMDHQAPWSNLHSTTNCSSCHARWSPVVKFWLSWTESHSFPPILCMVIKNKQMFEIYPSNCVSKSQQCLFIRKLCISDRYGSDAIRFLEIFCCVEKILVNSKWFQPLEAQTYSLTSATHKFCEFLGSNFARNHSYHTICIMSPHFRNFGSEIPRKETVFWMCWWMQPSYGMDCRSWMIFSAIRLQNILIFQRN